MSFTLMTLAIFAGGFFIGWFLKNSIEKKSFKITQQSQQELLNKASETENSLKSELQNLREQHMISEKNLSTLTAEKQQQKSLHTQFADRLENLSQKIIDMKSQQFQTQAKKDLEVLLDPLKNNIQTFQKKVEEAYNKEARERFSLGKEIQSLCEVHARLEGETSHLTQALKGDIRVQGHWGEMILETILQNSGLIKGEHYIIQGKGLNIKDAEGRQQKPDTIINLPDNKHLVIDSKVSFTHYERYIATDSKEEKTKNLKLFINSLKTHVKQLSEKDYTQTSHINTPDFTFMFFPIEGALSLAFQNDKELFRFSWKHNIALVSPISLSATLKVVESIWRHEKQNRHASDIASESGKLYDKFVLFVTDLEQIGKNLTNAQKSYDHAIGKLHTGQGNIVSKLDKIKALGARTSKQLPPSISINK